MLRGEQGNVLCPVPSELCEDWCGVNRATPRVHSEQRQCPTKLIYANYIIKLHYFKQANIISTYHKSYFNTFFINDLNMAG